MVASSVARLRSYRHAQLLRQSSALLLDGLDHFVGQSLSVKICVSTEPSLPWASDPPLVGTDQFTILLDRNSFQCPSRRGAMGDVSSLLHWFRSSCRRGVTLLGTSLEARSGLPGRLALGRPALRQAQGLDQTRADFVTNAGGLASEQSPDLLVDVLHHFELSFPNMAAGPPESEYHVIPFCRGTSHDPAFCGPINDLAGLFQLVGIGCRLRDHRET
mmetsp:Transcript_92425/g.261106  ORF Transcript_92425/g.261106 Transcript_92425/m.261106 type:complete len:217 (-) Transcript_92425:609-1259(-)